MDDTCSRISNTYGDTPPTSFPDCAKISDVRCHSRRAIALASAAYNRAHVLRNTRHTRINERVAGAWWEIGANRAGGGARDLSYASEMKHMVMASSYESLGAMGRADSYAAEESRPMFLQGDYMEGFPHRVGGRAISDLCPRGIRVGHQGGRYIASHAGRSGQKSKCVGDVERNSVRGLRPHFSAGARSPDEHRRVRGIGRHGNRRDDHMGRQRGNLWGWGPDREVACGGFRTAGYRR